MNMPGNRNDPSLTRYLEILSGEINISISQEINSLRNRMNSQIESSRCSAIFERIIPQMQGVVEAHIKQATREYLTKVQKT